MRTIPPILTINTGSSSIGDTACPVSAPGRKKAQVGSHMVKPLTDGHRLCLIYNLTLSKAKGPTSAPKHREHVDKIATVLSQWIDVDADPRMVALTLEHQYTQSGLSWDALKGVDAARARILAEAAAKAQCHAYLALLTFWESGSAEGDEDDYYSYRKRRYDEEDDEDSNAGDYEMGEVFDSSLTAERVDEKASASRIWGVVVMVGSMHPGI